MVVSCVIITETRVTTDSWESQHVQLGPRRQVRAVTTDREVNKLSKS